MLTVNVILFATVLETQISSPESKTILSSLRNTVSPAGIIKLLIIIFEVEADPPNLTRYRFTLQVPVSSLVNDIGVKLLHNTIEVIALTCPAGTAGGPADTDPMAAPVVELTKTLTGVPKDAEFTSVLVIISVSLKNHTKKQSSFFTY